MSASSFLLSAGSAACALVLILITALPLAFAVSEGSRRTGKIIDSLLLIPMLMPPTAVGFFLLMIFGRRLSPLAGCTASAFAVSFPILYRAGRNAVKGVDEETVLAARTLGIREWTIFRKVILPQARSGILSGLVLTFGRGIGEYGAVSILEGETAGRSGTVSQAIAQAVRTGDFGKALAWSLLMLACSAAAVLVMNLALQKKRKKRKSC